MTKGELIKALEGLDDDAQIMIEIPNEEVWNYNITGFCDKVTGDKLQNEITLVCGV